MEGSLLTHGYAGNQKVYLFPQNVFPFPFSKIGRQKDQSHGAAKNFEGDA
jgi:hypothetical protein